MQNMTLDCDCRMQWIYEKKAQFEKLIIDPICASDGKSLFSDAEKFLFCVHY